MLDVITFVTFLVGGTYAIYYGVRSLLKLMFQREPKNWVTQNYKQHSEVNLNRVKKVAVSGVLPTEQLSHWEMVAVFGLLLLKTEVSNVIQQAEIFGNLGWKTTSTMISTMKFRRWRRRFLGRGTRKIPGN